MKKRESIGWIAGGLAMLAVVLSGVLAPMSARGHGGTAVIVDTDMAADDARALALLLNSPDVHVMAVVTSDGACPPDVGATNVCRMLAFLKQDGVAVGIGRSLGGEVPAFRANATGLDWAKLGEPVVRGMFAATNLIRFALKNSSSRVYYICLGPLTNLGDALKDSPDLAGSIGCVLWFGSTPGAARPGWNAKRDEEAWRRIAAAGLRVQVVGWRDDVAAPLFDEALLDELALIQSPAAKLIDVLHRGGRGGELMRAKHMRLWDDLVALTLLNGAIGRISRAKDMDGWTEITAVDPVSVRQAMLSALRGLPERGTVVLGEFPVKLEMMRADVAPMAERIMARHGMEEWKAAVLTSELHRHLGTYSIVGAKMGLRARERFCVALDELRVESHAGLKPPLSCVNDGLQVATGASLGRGTITVITNAPVCEAVFSHRGARLRLSLKPEISRRIMADIAELEKLHGGTTPDYFRDVRVVSLKHWLDFDRSTMFQETMENDSTR